MWRRITFLFIFLSIYSYSLDGYGGALGLESEDESEGLSNTEVDLSYLESSLQPIEKELS